MANAANQVSYNLAADVVPSDTIDLARQEGYPGFPDAIYVGGAGVVACVFQNNVVVNFTCVAGQILPVTVRRVNATGTAATLLKALWAR